MSTVGRDLPDRTPSGFAGLIDRLSQPGRRFVAEHAEGTIVAFRACRVCRAVDGLRRRLVGVGGSASRLERSRALGAPLCVRLQASADDGVAVHAVVRGVSASGLGGGSFECDGRCVGLGITWRLLRDHLDKNRALLGLVALVLIPLYDIKTAILNANTVMIPFWAAALLFYLRARRGLGASRCLSRWRIRQPHDFRQVLGAVSDCRHGDCLSCRPGDAALLALARALRHGAWGCNRHCASRLVVRQRARRHQLHIHARHRRGQPVIRRGSAALGALPHQLRRLRHRADCFSRCASAKQGGAR